MVKSKIYQRFPEYYTTEKSHCWKGMKFLWRLLPWETILKTSVISFLILLIHKKRYICSLSQFCIARNNLWIPNVGPAFSCSFLESLMLQKCHIVEPNVKLDNITPKSISLVWMANVFDSRLRTWSCSTWNLSVQSGKTMTKNNSRPGLLIHFRISLKYKVKHTCRYTY